MGFFDNWPYTDFHRLNLDWVLDKMRELEEAVKNLDDPAKQLVKFADPIVWDTNKVYEARTIVLDGVHGNAYMSRKNVPAGTSLGNKDYWLLVMNANAQYEEMRQRLNTALDLFNNKATELKNHVDDIDLKLTGRITSLEEKGNIKMVCIGDSYLDGYLSDGNRWGNLLAQYMGASSVYLSSEGGAGFAATSGAGHSFEYLTANAAINAGFTPDIVIYGGGINDSTQGKTPQQIEAGVTAALNVVKNNWPDATVHIFGNLWSYKGYGIDYEVRSNAMRKACMDATAIPAVYHGGCWTWLFNKPECVASDGVHPNANGQIVIARSMYTELNGGDACVYSDSVVGTKAIVNRDYLNINGTIAIPDGSQIVANLNDVLLELPEAYDMAFTYFLGKGLRWDVDRTKEGIDLTAFIEAKGRTIKFKGLQSNIPDNIYPQTQGLNATFATFLAGHL